MASPGESSDALRVTPTKLPPNPTSVEPVSNVLEKIQEEEEDMVEKSTVVEEEDEEEQQQQFESTEVEEQDDKFKLGRDYYGQGFSKYHNTKDTHVLFLGPCQSPHYRWPLHLKDHFFKWVDKEGAKPTKIVWVRTNMDVKMLLIAQGVASFIRQRQKVQIDVDAVKVSLAGENVKEDYLWTKPAGSLFLLHEEELTEELREHSGKLWECKNCGLSKNQRSDVMQKKKKCRHTTFWFEGCHSGNSMGKIWSGRDTKPQFCPKGHFGPDEPIPDAGPAEVPTSSSPAGAASPSSSPAKKKRSPKKRALKQPPAASKALSPPKSPSTSRAVPSPPSSAQEQQQQQASISITMLIIIIIIFSLSVKRARLRLALLTQCQNIF